MSSRREGPEGKRGEKETTMPYNPVETGRAWTHGFLNQKPWHPLSYRNLQRKFEVEQKHLELERQREAAQKQLALEEEHYKSLSFLSSRDAKEYRDRQQLAFLYVKPPGMQSLATKTEPRDKSGEAPKGAQAAEAPRRSEKGYMRTMLKGHALCTENETVLRLGMAAPHGGFDVTAENQQLLFSDGEEEEPSSKRKKKKSKLRDKVKHAEAVLAAAGYDVDAINRQIDREVKKKRHRREKSTRV